MSAVATRKRPSRKRGLSDHGTWPRYCSGCRCDSCRTACLEYGRAHRAAKKAGVPFVPPAHLGATPKLEAGPQNSFAATPAVEMITRRYTYQATAEPQVGFRVNRAFGASRFVHNAYIALAREEYAAGRRHPSFFDGQKRIVTAGRKNPDTAWLCDFPAGMLSMSVRNAARAYENFFASVTGKRKGPRMGRPNFKKRSHRQTAIFPRGTFHINGGWEASSGRLWLSKVGYVRVNWHRPLPAEPSSVTMIRERTGKLRVSFVVETPKPVPATPARTGRTVGIDMGLTDFATLAYSDGTREKISNPKFLRQAEKKLLRLHRDLSRKQKGSKNRERARRNLARAHERVKNLRENHARQLSKQLVRENQAVAVEQLNVRGLARTRLAKSIHDAGWAMFLRYLEEGCDRHGRAFRKAPAGFPSSRLCAVCGTHTGPKPLQVRRFTCNGCGSVLDRDFNAAVNVLVAAGPAETVNACGRDVRHQLASFEGRGGAVTGEAGTHQKGPRVSGVSRRKPSAGAHAGGGNSLVHGPNSSHAIPGVLESPGKISDFPWKNVLEGSADPLRDKGFRI